MADRIKIGYFLEDRGHETFLKALVNRLAMEKGLKTGEWVDDVRSASGGKSIEAYRGFLKDITRRGATNPFDILIVASDGNCKGYQEKKNQLWKFAAKVKLSRADTMVLAIPDPHIERWYMSDPQAFNRAFGSGVLPVLPAYKCEKSHYKKIMQDAIATSNVRPLFGGYEYGERIVEEMDLYEAAKADGSLKHFIDDLGDAIKQIRLKNGRE
jgi:hypothetical protein